MAAVEELERWLRSVYGAGRWIAAHDVDVAAAAAARRLLSWGAEEVLVLAARRGSWPAGGPPADLSVHALDLPPAPMMEAIQAGERALGSLPPPLQAVVDRFDPERRARAVRSFLSDGSPVGGRRTWGARPAAWQALEDKVTVDALWDAAGVPRAPVEVVPAEPGALRAAAGRLDRGAGTVWSADASAGFHGGATYTCRVTDEATAIRAAERLAGRGRLARVMPALEGIPCSVHGIVFPAGVVVLRPAEMVVLRAPSSPTGFLYARAGTFWDPAPARREELRAVARRVGEHLRATLGYRGAFTVDGVMTGEGFRPTELNPRVGAALAMMSAAVPFSFLSDALAEGLDPPVEPGALEEEVLAEADARRQARLGVLFPGSPGSAGTAPLSLDGGRLLPAGDAPADAVATLGPGASGVYAQLEVDPSRFPVGRSLGPLAVAFVDWLDRVHGAGLGPVEAAHEV